MRNKMGILVILVVISPLLVLYLYKHSENSKTEYHHRKHIVLDYLHHDSASVWGKVVRYKKANKLATTKNKSHFEYEFILKNKKYNGLVYETELHKDNLKLNLSDSIKVVYSQSDPFLNIPHMIADDLHSLNQ